MNLLIESNGRKIAVQRTGLENGPALVFLHHGLGAIRSWKEQIQEFSNAGFNVIAFDRWGHGDSAQRDRWSMPDFEPDLADLQVILDHFSCPQAALIGHSDGGTIAMHYASKHPCQVTCLVLIAAHIYIEPKMAAGIQTLIREFENNPGFRRLLRRVHGSKSETLFWGWIQGWTQPDLQGWDMRPQINQISCPTLVVQGIEDEHASPRHARDLAGSIPNAKLWLVPGAGHMLPQENTPEFNRHVLKFLRLSLALPTCI